MLARHRFVVVLFLFLMANSASLALAADSSPAAAKRASSHLYSLAHRGPGQVQELLDRGYDVVGQGEKGELLVAGHAEDEAYFSTWGRPAVIKEMNRGLPMRKDLTGNLADYHTYAETQALVQSLAATYPTVCELQTMGTSLEGRDIPVLRITNLTPAKAGVPLPEVLIMGNLHARELMAVEMPLRFAEYLVTNYGTDPQVTTLVDSRDIYVAPMLNPDGHVYVENNNSGDWWTWWRKNRRDNGDGTMGVDLNRNFGFQWGFDNVGSSPNTNSAVYRGPSAFSEPETQAIETFCALRNFTLAFSYHSFGDLLLYPWGYQYDYTVDHELFYTLGQRLTAENGYFPGNPAEGAIYTTNGGSDDWAYGDTLSKNSFICFTPEVNSSADGGFGPPDTQIIPTFNENLAMNLRLVELADEPRKVLGPIVPVLSNNPPFASPLLSLDWTANDPLDPNPVVSYELEEFKNLGAILDFDADALSPLFDFGGFSLSTTQMFEGSGSYFSGAGDNLANTLTTTAPFAVTPATSTFSARLRYDIELDWDYAYLQASSDGGLIWQNLAGNLTTNTDPNGSNLGEGITGNTGGLWASATFDLSAYVGQTIALRLAYITDGAVTNPGLWIDVPSPVPSFESSRIVVAGHPTNTLDVNVTEAASFSYRVRAMDADGDISRWSNIVSTTVDPVTATSDALPSYSHLSGNYPNPFNPRTLVSYTVGTPATGSDAQVRLDVYDLAGRHVSTLVDTTRAPGAYRETWNGNASDGGAMPSGVYVARLVIDGETVSAHKMTLLR